VLAGQAVLDPVELAAELAGADLDRFEEGFVGLAAGNRVAADTRLGAARQGGDAGGDGELPGALFRAGQLLLQAADGGVDGLVGLPEGLVLKLDLIQALSGGALLDEVRGGS
jgi:hypothetical protein